jgi:hypothetical protein
MRKGRQADSARRRQRVIATLNRATADGTEITVTGIARAAAVDRAFLYRHRDLLGKIHALEAAPPAGDGTAGPAVTCASLQADLLAAHERSVRLDARVRQLEKHLSEALGEQAWRESGLGAPAESTPSARRSPTSNSRPSTCAFSSRNATRTWPRPGPPTVSSWRSSTPRHGTDDTPHPVLAPHLPRTLTSFHQPLSCANAKHGLRRSR